MMESKSEIRNSKFEIEEEHENTKHENSKKASARFLSSFQVSWFRVPSRAWRFSDSGFWISSFMIAVFLVTFLGCQKADSTRIAADLPPTIKTQGGVEMVLIPAGSFRMGNHGTKED